MDTSKFETARSHLVNVLEYASAKKTDVSIVSEELRKDFYNDRMAEKIKGLIEQGIGVRVLLTNGVTDRSNHSITDALVNKRALYAATMGDSGMADISRKPSPTFTPFMSRFVVTNDGGAYMLHMGSETDEGIVLVNERATLRRKDVKFGLEMVRSFDAVVHSGILCATGQRR